MNESARPFLTARWVHLAMLNYEVDPAVLRPYVPAGTELDPWEGRTLASMVGFQFLDTRVLGVPVPFHRDFDEVNLRFYVRREGPEGMRRGVVFVKEIVPRRAIAWVARGVYNEPYVALPMRHHDDVSAESGGRVQYEWKTGPRWNRMRVDVEGEASIPHPDSEDAFITEHYWGYTRQRDGSTQAYRVEHPPWAVWRAATSAFDCDVAGLYGEAFVPFLDAPPRSAFLAAGSDVVVRRGVGV